MSVGMPGFDLKRRVIRAAVNPLDVSTVVSILPKIVPPEVKPTIQPGIFQIPYGTYEKPGFLEVGSSSWWKEMEDGQPFLEIPHSSVQVADSIIKDFSNGILGCDMGDRRPGIFYLPGKWDINSIKTNSELKAMIELANTRQKNWFTELVRIADTLWARTNGNPLTISSDMKLAASELQLKDKPWLKDFQTTQLVNCKACGGLKNPLYPVCSSCRAVDITHPEAKNLKFAQM